MDERLELTEKQKEIISRYNAIVKEMEDAKIELVHREFNELYAFNAELVADTCFYEDYIEGVSVKVELEDLPLVECPYGLCLVWNDDHSFCVSFEQDF